MRAFPRVPARASRGVREAAMDRPTHAAHAARRRILANAIWNGAQTLTLGGPAITSTESRSPTQRFLPPRPDAAAAGGTFAEAGKRGRRALIALAMAATAFWATASYADDAVERALSLVSQKKYSEARALLEPLLRRAPNAPRVRLLNGILLTREGKAGEAAAIFQRLREERPEMFEPYNNLAVLYAGQGRFDEARDMLLAALQRRLHPVAYANLGDVYMRLADRAYSRARDVRGNSGAAVERIPTSRPPAPSARRAEPTAATGARNGPLALVADPGKSGTAPTEASGGECVQAGTFKDRKALAGAVEWMQSQGAEVIDLRHEKAPVVRSYRVYLPALPSAAAAARTLRELRGRGIRDVAAIRKGAGANRISLGVFKSKSNADRRVAQLGKLGYSPKSAPISKSLDAYAVRARADGATPDLVSAWKEKFPGQPIGAVDCP